MTGLETTWAEMSWIDIIDWVSLITGIFYILLEIGQKNAMWILGIFTGLACAVSFGYQQAWASMGLNIYYIIVSVLGLIQWRKDDEAAGEGIHLRKLTAPVVVASVFIFIAGTPLLIPALKVGGDPVPWLDSSVFMISAIGTWWLARAYPQQWLLWIVADAMTTALCISLGNWPLSILYVAYTLAAIYGFIHWTKKGKRI